VLTANHISNIDDGLSVFIRSEKPGAAGEVLPLKFIKRYPQEDLAVVAFLSFTNYKVAEVGEASQLDDDNQVYVAGWPGAENREGFQFTPAKVTNPQVGDNLTYQPTEPGEDVYKGMSGGAVLNEAGQLVGIHVGLTKVGGDGEGVLISTFLQMAPPEVEEVLVRSTPDVLSSSSSENEKVKLRRQLEEERRKREEMERRVQKLEVEQKKQEERKAKQKEKHKKWIAKKPQPQRQLEEEKRHRWVAELRELPLVGGFWTFGLSGWIYHAAEYYYANATAWVTAWEVQARQGLFRASASSVGWGVFSVVAFLVLSLLLAMGMLPFIVSFGMIFSRGVLGPEDPFEEWEEEKEKWSFTFKFLLLIVFVWGWIWCGLIVSMGLSVAFCGCCWLRFRRLMF
jgi:hypothetical protein